LEADRFTLIDLRDNKLAKGLAQGLYRPADMLLTVNVAAHGRERCGEKFASRTLDIDLLTYGDQVIKEGKVEIPREEITRYAFVLLPLAEVAGDEQHPVLGLSYRELWQGFDGEGQVLAPVEFELFPANTS
ncbi:2-amino-4-hydroxy-6-hydroxymethyldihydropteridine diphosphokinase, partial [Pseudomonadota bacterium]